MFCELCLSDWQKGDDPTEEHRKRSPDCSFWHAKSVKGPCPQRRVDEERRVETEAEAEPEPAPKGKPGRKKGKSTSRTASMATDNDESEIVLPKRGTRTRSQSRQPEELQQSAQPTAPRQPSGRRTTSRTASQQKKVAAKPTTLEDVVESPKKPLPPTPKEDTKNPTDNLSPLPELSNSNGIRSSRQALSQFNKSPSRLKESSADTNKKNTKVASSTNTNNSDQNNDRSLTLAEFIRKCVTDEANKMRETGETQINKFESSAKRGEDELRAKLSQTRL